MKHRCFKAACGKILSFILALLLLSGCAKQGETPGALPLGKEMPPALTRGHMRESSFDAKLYFITEDGRSLSAENRLINCDGGMSRAEAAIRAMQNGPESDALTRSIPHGLIFNGIELSHDVCNVYFSGSLPSDARAWLAMRAALSSTVRAVEGIGTVNVYFDGYEPGYAGKALGALAPVSAALDTYLSNMRQQYEPLLDENTEAGAFETRLATLYFTDLSGKLLIAANRSISYDAKLDKSSLAAMLINSLLEGDTSNGRFEPVLPADLVLEAAPVIKYEAATMGPPPQLPSSWAATPTPSPTNAEETPEQPEAGKTEDLDEACVIELVFKKPQLEYNQNMMCGAITLMLTGYIPKVKGVRISILGENGLAESLGDKEYFERKDFSTSIGHSVFLAFPDAEGAALRKVERIVPSWNTYVPVMRLSELFKGPADPGVMHPLFTEEHVRAVYVTGDLAVVDWEEGFMETLRQLSGTERVYAPGAQPERLFIYGVVNTLTEIPGVSRVWMLENGQKLGMIGNMYLGNALLRNPGILLGG